MAKYAIFPLLLVFGGLLVRISSALAIPLYDRFIFHAPSPQFINSYANFDGVHYMNIATNGYSGNNYVFPPLYPAVLRLIGFAGGNLLAAGILLFLVFLGLSYLLLQLFVPTYISNRKNSIWFAVLFTSFPTAFFLTSLYSEVIFLPCVISFFYLVQRRKIAWAALFAFFAALTKVAGLFLIIPLMVELVGEYRKQRIAGGKLAYRIFLSLAPLWGLAAYSVYLAMNSQSPLSFINLHSTFGAGRAAGIILFPQVIYRYLKIFFTADINLKYFVALVEFFFFSAAAVLLCLDLKKLISSRHKNDFFANRLGLNLYSFANILVPPLTGTFLSVPRFALLSLSVFLYLSELESKKIKMLVAGMFILLHVALLALFSRGYFVS